MSQVGILRSDGGTGELLQPYVRGDGSRGGSASGHEHASHEHAAHHAPDAHLADAVSRHPLPQASVPAGRFAMGDGYGDGRPGDGESLVHEVELAGFSIDATSVTNAAFARFADATGYVTWNDAVAYCAWAGRRMPTEAEREYASRGGLDAARYPWGDELLGLDYYAASPGRDPQGPASGSQRVLRGGSFLCHDSYCNRYRNSARSSNTPDSSMANAGFRTVALRSAAASASVAR